MKYVEGKQTWIKAEKFLICLRDGRGSGLPDLCQRGEGSNAGLWIYVGESDRHRSMGLLVFSLRSYAGSLLIRQSHQTYSQTQEEKLGNLVMFD